MNVRRHNMNRGYVLLPVMLMVVVVAALAFMLNRSATMDVAVMSNQAQADQLQYVAEAAINHARWSLNRANCSNYQDLAATTLGTYMYSATVSPKDGSPVTIDAVATDAQGISRTRVASMRIFEAPTKWFRDEFVQKSYAGNDGNANWTGDWQEMGETTSTSQGRVQNLINSRCALDRCLRIGGNANMLNGRGIFRELDLSAAKDATLTFSYRRQIGVTGGSVTLAISGNGGTTWTDLQTYQFNSGESNQIAQTFDVTGFASSDTQIRFLGSGIDVDAYIYIDNVQVKATYPGGAATSTLNPGANIDDATIDKKEPMKNYGDEPKIIVSAFGTETSNALIRFDLSSLPTGTVIKSATLSVYLGTAAPQASAFSVHRVRRNWTEGTMQGAEPADGATWYAYDGSNAWAVYGGDYDAAPMDSVLYTNKNQRYEFDISVAVSDWLDRGQPNYGVLLKGTNGIKQAEFFSGDETDSSTHPTLTVSYACECGQGCSATGPATVMFVVSNANKLNAQDDFKKTLIENWGHIVVPINASDSQTEYNVAMTTADVIYISMEVKSGQVGTKATYAPIGIVSEKAYLNDKLGFSSSRQTVTGSQIDILDNTHFITESFPIGLSTIVTSNQDLQANAGTLANDLQVLAERPSSSSKMLSILDDGDTTYNHGPATSRRVMLPFGSTNFDITTLNSSGQLLMQRAIEWALYRDQINTGLVNTLLMAQADNCIEENSGSNHGSDNAVISGVSAADRIENPLVRFDTTSIPIGSTVQNAMLRLYATSRNTSYADVVNSMNPAGYWRLGETAGVTAIDASGNAMHGVYQNNPLLGEPSFGDDPDYAVEFDGNDDFVDLGTIDAAGSGITMTAWVRFNRLTGQSQIITKADGTSESGFYWSLYAKGQKLNMRLRINGEREKIQADTVILSTGPWYFVAGTYNGAAMTLFFNGLPVKVKMKPGTLGNNPAIRAAIGANPLGASSATRHLEGALDEVAVFDRALSAGEIMTLYNAYTDLDLEIAAHKVNQDWTETGSNWATADGSTAWSGGSGGNYELIPVTTVSAVDTGWYEWDVTPLVQEWVDGVSNNHGVQLVNSKTYRGLNVIFDSREGFNVPELHVEYTKP